MTSIPIAYVRIRPADAPADVNTYVAVRPADLADLVAESGDTMTIEPCQLNLPQHVTDRLAADLAAPLKRVTSVIGTTEGGVWVTGLLEGQPAPGTQ